MLPKNAKRKDILNVLEGSTNIGVELGVARGDFSKIMQSSKKFKTIIGIDCYDEKPFHEHSHDISQYKKAVTRMGIFSNNYKILRMRFEEALDLFDDNSLDFLYVDGYAHSGQNGGETIFDWYSKVKIGGVIAGDDYHEDWPLTIKAVDEFVKQTTSKLYVTKYFENEITKTYSDYPSWLVIKRSNKRLKASKININKGKRANYRVHIQREYYRLRKKYLTQFIPKPIKDLLRKFIDK